jgi:gamma-glutamylcysteine synthetase
MAETPCAAGPDLVGPFMAVVNAFPKDGVDHAEPLTIDAAYPHSSDAALAESAVGTVGLEIEAHLVDLDHIVDPVSWKHVETVAAVARNVAPDNAVTVEPGGQIELSGGPAAGISASVARLRYESTGARLALAPAPRARLCRSRSGPPVRAREPRLRYLAMEQHFAVTGRAAAGRVMMNSTAAPQVNLQAGPRGPVAGAGRAGLSDRPDPGGDRGQFLRAARARQRRRRGRAYLFDFLINT